MAWTTTIILDEDKTDTGQVSAVFTDPNDSAQFTFVQRVKATAQGRDAFITAAIAARNAWQTRRASEASYKTNIDARFVAMDV